MLTNTINTNLDPTRNRVFIPGPTSKKPNPPLNPKPSSLHFSPNPSSCKSLISAMALHLCRPKHRFPTNPSLIHLFSTSADDDDDKNATQTTPTTNKTSLNSYFSDVKASLKKQTTTTTSPYSSSLEEIRKNLAEYRQRSAPPPPPPPPTGESTSAAASQSHPISFQELYRRNQNLNQNSEVKSGGGKLSFEAIRESLRQMRANSNMNMNDNRSKMNAGNNADSLSMLAFGNSLMSKGQDGIGGSGSRVIGGTQELPVSVFGREMKEGKKGGEREGEREGMKTEFVKIYNYAELGEKLRQLRPEGGKSGTGFSLQELNERLMRLRELEKKDRDSQIHGVPFRELRETLVRLSQSGEEKQKKSSAVRLDILGHIGGTPSFMLHPPKEHLVEKYFHPDNMSSAEKMKIELAKVREDFKMSESDCGSARVQVAQLTTKIKHLSSVLHKRDKHSLKGLLAMVQKRKRLLKYLRRTDWDSYCFVLSKLGLRDNPDYKA